MGLFSKQKNGDFSSHRLTVPAFIIDNNMAKELLSVWKQDNGPQTFLIDQDACDDPAAWGLLLVDIARHVSKAYEQNKKISREDAFKRLMEGFNAELSSSTDDF